MSEQPDLPVVRPPSDSSPSSSLVVIRYVPRTLDMHPTSESDMRSLLSYGSPLHPALFGVTAGLAAACALALLTVPLDPVPHATVVGILVPSLFLAVYFGAMTAKNRSDGEKKVAELTSRTEPSVRTISKG